MYNILMTKNELEEIKESVYELAKNCHDQHCSDHLNRVASNAQKAVLVLNLENKIDQNLLQAICFLHDITYFQKKQKRKAFTYLFERKIVKKILTSFLSQKNISSEEKQIILNACSRHPHSFPFKRLNKTQDSYTKVLQDSDTLDFFSQHQIFKFKAMTKKSFYAPIYQKISEKLVAFGRKNLKNYLNYPVLYEQIFLAENNN
jgi:HD superfamily phosphodiesterase